MGTTRHLCESMHPEPSTLEVFWEVTVLWGVGLGTPYSGITIVYIVVFLDSEVTNRIK